MIEDETYSNQDEQCVMCLLRIEAGTSFYSYANNNIHYHWECWEAKKALDRRPILMANVPGVRFTEVDCSQYIKQQVANHMGIPSEVLGIVGTGPYGPDSTQSQKQKQSSTCNEECDPLQSTDIRSPPNKEQA